MAALLIGVSKAGFGGGMGILVGPLLALLFEDARASIGWMLPLLFVCDIVSLLPYWKKWDPRNVKCLLPGALFGIFIGDFALGIITEAALGRLIGALAIFFCLLQIVPWTRPKPGKTWEPAWWFGVMVGVGTGFISTLSHVGGVLTTMFLLQQNLDNIRFVGTTTFVYFFINLAKLPLYVKRDLVNVTVVESVLPFVPIVIAATFLGVWLNRRISGLWFGRIVRGLVLITGLMLLFPGWRDFITGLMRE